MTNYQDAREILRTMIKDRSYAEVRNKVNNPSDNSNHGQYAYGSEKKKVVIMYTEEEGYTYICLFGFNGLDYVEMTFKTDQFSIEDVVRRIENETDINFTHE